jgi:dTDP-4-amino-4,6-dideoxygalactose transaminase
LVAHRAAVAKYRSVLSRCGVGGWLAWMDPDEVLIRFPLMIKNPERMISTFAKRGIECGRWFDYPLSPAPADPSAFNYTPGQCKTAEQVSRHIINLPTHPRLAATDLENVCAALDGYLGERAEERDFISDWTERAHAALVVELQV